ncbi:acyltransferase family protein [Actinomadura sp. 9N407]|uniref:acyltransferase family protein n=1 Tax=Actinomadura sp. 9N407 TaxID=3375154 RepID=UPI003790B883
MTLNAPSRTQSATPEPAATLLPAPAERLRILDLLRFIAVAAVMMYHFTGVPTTVSWGRQARQVFPELASAAYFGQYGYELFFMISGFVILMAAHGRGVGEFAISRIARLYPAYWFAVSLALVLYLVTGVKSGTTGDLGVVRSYLPNMTMLQAGVGVPHIEIVYWALWVTLHFYVLVALLVWSGRLTYARCVVFMGGWLLLSVFALEGDMRFLDMALIATWSPYFVAGMAFYLIYRYGPNPVPWLIVFFCYGLGVHFTLKRIKPPLDWPGVDEKAVPLLLAAFFLVMALVATRRLRWPNGRLLTALGALTYPLYLVHETVSRPLINSLFPYYSRWAVLAVAIATSIAAAYLIHKLVEGPAQKLLRRRLKTALAQISAGGGRGPDPNR